ncbi:MAG: prepilin peptidase [Acidobacteria bacterium]|nr:prepilin peptidase [Acidobacteriota bacterium]
MLDGLPLLAAFAGLIGLLIGSFLNVCIYRLPRDLSTAYPRRSFCPHCGKTVAWYDNIPVLSWLLLRGRCRACGAGISIRYALVELLTAATFVSAYWQHGASGEALRLALFSAVLIVLLFTDMETYILPDEFTLGGAAAGWVMATLWPPPPGLITLFLPMDRLPAGEGLAASVLGGLIPAGMIWSIGAAYERLRGREGLGFGDVKMMLTLGAFAGLEGTLLTVAVASVLGSLVGMVRVVTRGRTAMLDELPLGSFLAFAGLLLAHLGHSGRLY